MSKKDKTKTTSKKNIMDDSVMDKYAFKEPEDQAVEEVVKESSLSTRGKKPQRRKTYVRPTSSDLPDYVTEKFLEDGYALRLVRWAIRGQPDYRYLNRREQEGYEFVTAEELPEEYLRTMRLRDTHVATGLVTNGDDLCLMKIDLDLQQSRVDFYNEQAQRELDSVDVHVLERKGILRRRGLQNTGSRSKVMMREPSFAD